MDKKIYILAPVVAAGLFYFAAAFSFQFSTPLFNVEKMKAGSLSNLQEQVVPSRGVRLPIKWEDLGVRMIEAGIINNERFEALYANRGGLDEEMKKLLYGKNNGEIKITPENSGTLLNLLWALGLGNKNEILEKGPMSDPKYGGAGGFASTGGWTLADGSTMNHYSAHSLIILTEGQQELVERVSKNIYRPCCSNPTHFPDCNHGMAMLGFLELMASQDASEEEMYRAALAVNSYWFPDTYLAIAQFLEIKGFDWRKAEPKDLLGYNFSSSAGYQQVLSELKSRGGNAGGSCGV
ncbi:MAG: hypothetical protein A2918_01055 [Candidatus Yanofskybacteria bacterium RIFCSPLOWO2_01_FULL_42_49]|uniref:Uncharacterized protein n=1 Tax=Candidatus Yanofskybacteria bacterium RIFCSPLOWO2_01_FULL_42_49 TaxID=1802694 RepID=A0A1F8GBA3_9BACT|nr:MAG: hypothetical protein A2918_01055 [Candidatus Yanofskybacteria bacterium RIFCSPLOWO2_01_FULL_42_49]